MDTVTRAEMAIAVAEEGGLGIIDRGFRSGEIEPQVREVQIVKRKQHGVISDPYTIAPDASLAEAAARMRDTGVGTLVVVDAQRRVQGLLTTRDLRFVDQARDGRVAHDAARSPGRAHRRARNRAGGRDDAEAARSRSFRC